MTTGVYPMLLDPDPVETGKAVVEAAKAATGTNWASLGVTSLVALITGFVALREWFSRNAVTNAANGAQTELINLLREQIKTESSRADKADQARSEALQIVDTLKTEIQKLTLKVESLEAQIQNVKA